MKKQMWLELLLKNGGNAEEFNEIESCSRNELFALCEYKAILRQRGEGQVEIDQLQAQYDNNNLQGLQDSLNLMTLEYHTQEQIINLLDLMKQTGTSIKQIYNRHLQNTEDVLLSLITL